MSTNVLEWKALKIQLEMILKKVKSAQERREVIGPARGGECGAMSESEGGDTQSETLSL